MIEPRYLNTLRIICARLSEQQLNWVVTGSLGLALQGMDIIVHDIDLQSDENGAYAIAGLLSEYVLKPVQYLASERIRSHLGLLEIEGVKVDIMGDVQKLLKTQVWEEPVKVEHYKHWMDFNGLQVPVLSLEYEYQAYLKLGRIKKAEKIKIWLDGNHSNYSE